MNQQQGSDPNRFSKQKPLFVRPVSMNSNMVTSLNKNKNNALVYSRGTTNSNLINPQINIKNGQFQTYNSINNGINRPTSPPANIPLNKYQGLTRSLENVPINPIGFRQTAQQIPSNKRPDSPGTFFTKYYS